MIKTNVITTEKDLIAFKREVLTRLKTNIDKFAELDNKSAAKKAEEEAAKADTPEGGAEEAEEDPFAGIFDDEEAGGAKTNEFEQEKTKLATEFVAWLKEYKVQFLKDVRLNREKETSYKFYFRIFNSF